MNFIKIYDKYIKISDICSIIELEDNDMLILLKNFYLLKSCCYVTEILKNIDIGYIRSRPQKYDINKLTNECFGNINSNFNKNMIYNYKIKETNNVNDDNNYNYDGNDDNKKNLYYIKFKNYYNFELNFNGYHTTIYIKKYARIYNKNLYNELKSINWNKIDCVVYIDKDNRMNIDKVLNYGI